MSEITQVHKVTKAPKRDPPRMVTSMYDGAVKSNAAPLSPFPPLEPPLVLLPFPVPDTVPPVPSGVRCSDD